MDAQEIQSLSQSIALHPILAIGGLMVLISIGRKIDLNYKEANKNAEWLKQMTAEQSISRQDAVANDPSSSLEIDSHDLNTSINT